MFYRLKKGLIVTPRIHHQWLPDELRIEERLLWLFRSS